MTSGDVRIEPIESDRNVELFELFAPIVAEGEGYPQTPPLTWADFDAMWVHHVTAVVGAFHHDTLVGAYYLKPNFLGRAGHIANAGYVVGRPAQGKGIGTALVEDSIQRAPALGFDAIQFNLVFVSNPARRLYERFGWREIGRIPDAVASIDSASHVREDALIYWRTVP